MHKNQLLLHCCVFMIVFHPERLDNVLYFFLLCIFVFYLLCCFLWRRVYFLYCVCHSEKITVWRNRVEARCRLCTGDLLPRHLSALQEVFLWLTFSYLVYLWRFLCWQMYSFYCNFPLLNMKSSGMQRRWGQLLVCLFVCFLKGALKRIHLAKGSTTTQTLVEGQWCLTTSAFPLRKEGISCHKSRRLLWRIRFFWGKKSVVLMFCGIVIKLLVLFVWQFCCDSGALFEGGKWGERIVWQQGS